MNKTQENKLSMYYEVQEVCHAHNSVWVSLVAFANAFTTFETDITKIESLLQVQETGIKGITADKEAIKTKMIDLALKVAHALYAFASSKNDLKLKDKMEFSRSKLQKVRDAISLQHCRTIKEEAQAHIAALADYGVTATELTDLQTKIDNTAKVIVAPRTAIVERKGASEELDKLMHKADALLNDQLDKLAENFRTSHAAFYKLYFNARSIMDLGTRHQQATDDTSSSSTLPPTTP